MSRRSFSRRLLGVSIVSLSCLGILIASDAMAADAYREGLASFDAGDWNGAARRFRQAISEDSRERAGTSGEDDYLPHFYLGMSMARNNNCFSALEHWRESESQGAIRQAAVHQEWVSERAACEDRLLESATTSLRGILEQATGYREMLAEQKSEPLLEPFWKRNPSLSTSARRSLERYGKLEREFEAAIAAKDLTAIFELEAPALELSRDLESLTTRVVESARRQVAEADRSQDDAGARSTGVVSPALASAAQSYFRGEYEIAIRLLEEATPAERWQRAQVELFRAASEFSLYRLGGEADPDRLAAADTAIASGLALDAGLQPDPEAFSPGFRAFFAAARD